jgi:putative transposase
MAKHHTSHLRRGRASEPGRIYLVTTVTQERRPLFSDLYLGRVLVESLKWSDHQQRSQTWAFVIMPDHLHWLFALGDDWPLSQTVASVKKFSARRIGESAGLCGGVWQAGFHDHALRAEEDLRETARYVVMNPVRSGLVRSIGAYSLWDARWV